jgi:hypothetical protein
MPVQARLWNDRPAELPGTGQLYVVGYLASGGQRCTIANRS